MTVAGPGAFPRARWAALGWLSFWFPVYAWNWGFLNFVSLCDVAVILTCFAVWRGSAVLLSSQAVGALLINSLWTLDVAWRLLAGSHLIGGTEYMWDARFPLWLRLVSLFHVVWPAVLVLALRRVGYDPRGLSLQCGVALVCLALGRLLGDAEKNLNFSFSDPVLHRQWGPPAVHVAAMLAGTIVVLYWPTHRALARLLPPARRDA